MELLFFCSCAIGAIAESLPGFLPMPSSDLKNRSCSASSFIIAAFRWVAHASRVLVAASAPQRTFVNWPFRKSVGCRSEVNISRKFVVARRENQHARRECHPIELRLA